MEGTRKRRASRSLFWGSATLLVNFALLTRPFAPHLEDLPSVLVSFLGGGGGRAYERTLPAAQVPMPYTEPARGNKLFFYPGFGRNESDSEWDISHSSLWQPSVGLEFSQCLTYNERYARYEEPLPPSLWRPRRRSKIAVNVRCVSFRLSDDPPPDFLRHLRALITEIELGLGHDVYIVVDMKPEDLPIESWIERVPEEFRYRILPFDWAEDIQYRYDDDTLGLIWEDNHATALWFLRQPVGQQYDFLWQIERDVRMVGGSWLQWWNRLSLAAQEADATFPDLVTLRGIQRDTPDSRRERCEPFLPAETISKTWVTFWGLSRRMSELMETRLQAGNSCYVELFVPSVALAENASIFSPNVPIWVSDSTKADTFHCCGNATFEYYQQWRDDPNLCRPGPAIIHAYKAERAPYYTAAEIEEESDEILELGEDDDEEKVG